MQSIKWLAVLTAVIVITACFFTWISVEEKNFFIGGLYSSDDRFGKPGLFHIIFCSIYIVLSVVNKIWSIRTAFFIAALNLAWAVRNFFIISACVGGECPETHTGLYTIVIGSLMLIILTPLITVPTK